MKIRTFAAVLFAILSIGGTPSSLAAVTGTIEGAPLGGGGIENFTVPLFKSRVLALSVPASRVSIGNPDIADILIVRASQLYVLGKDLGTTNVHLWDRNDRLIGTVSVEVAHDIESLKSNLYHLLPDEPIEVHSVQRSIMLRGRVSSITAMEAALQTARAYLAQIQTSKGSAQFEQGEASRREDKSVGSVINMMEVSGGQQVMLVVKIAEIARSELRRINAQFNLINTANSQWTFGGVNGGATFPDAILNQGDGRIPVFGGEISPIGPVVDEFLPNPLQIENQGLFTSFLSNTTLFNFALDAAKENGMAKILAEPTLTTLTGQEAKFLSGGEFPIPVPNGDNGVGIQFKEFGVALQFTPLVLDSETINIKVGVEVSELVNSNTIGVSSEDASASFIIPSLIKRSANSMVELREGQTIGIAGLINENLRQVVTKFPGLGEIPVLGALFRSQEFLSNETELVILVTPHIAKPIAPEDIRLPTDKFVEPSDLEFYLLGRTEGRKKRSRSPREEGGVESEFGHSIDG